MISRCPELYYTIGRRQCKENTYLYIGNVYDNVLVISKAVICMQGVSLVCKSTFFEHTTFVDVNFFVPSRYIRISRPACRVHSFLRCRRKVRAT